MEQLLDLLDAMIDEYGQDDVRAAANKVGLDINSIKEGISEARAFEIHDILLDVLMNDFATYDRRRAMNVANDAGHSDEVIEELFNVQKNNCVSDTEKPKKKLNAIGILAIIGVIIIVLKIALSF